MDYGQHAEAENQPGFFRRALRFIILVALVVVAALCIRTYVAEPFQVPSGSMEDTIVTGDRIFAEKVSYLTGEPQQGDIVVFTDPQVPSRILVKRVIATEGQTVDLQDGTVYVDGVALSEPYTEGKPSYPLATVANVEISYPYTVPAGCVWVMGDNRTNSADSRYFGPIDVDSVSARAFATYWPIEHIGLLE